MGSGKSTVAKALSKELDKKVIDMDFEIEREEGRSIVDIFDEEGEGYFRDLETDFLERLISKNNKIIATGGGIIMRDQNVELLHHIGTVVFLQADVGHIYNNIKKNTSRPLLQVDDVQEEIRTRLEQREPHYLKAANVIIQTSGKSIIEITNEIVTIL